MKNKKMGDEWIEKYDSHHYAHPQDETKEDLKFSAKRELKELNRDAKFRMKLKKEAEERKKQAKKKEKFLRSLAEKTPDRERAEAEFAFAIRKIQNESTCPEMARLLKETLDECCQEAFLDLAERDIGINRFYEGYEKGKKRSDN